MFSIISIALENEQESKSVKEYFDLSTRMRPSAFWPKRLILYLQLLRDSWLILGSSRNPEARVAL